MNKKLNMTCFMDDIRADILHDRTSAAVLEIKITTSVFDCRENIHKEECGSYGTISELKAKSMQRSGTEASRTQIQSSNPKREA